MRRMFSLLLACMLVSGGAVAHAKSTFCEAPSVDRVKHSVVELTIMYDAPTVGDNVGHRGSGVFVTPTTIATVEHVADRIEDGVIIGWSEEFDVDAAHRFELPVVNVRYIDTGLAERIAFIELSAPIEGRQAVGVRYRPLTDQEPVFGISFRGGAMRFAEGYHQFPEHSSDPSAKSSGMPPLLFELADWKNRDRMVFDHGSSGGPVFDCEGRLVALIMQVVTQELDLGGVATAMSSLRLETPKTMRVSTPWGDFNVTGLHGSLIVVAE